MRGGGWMDAGGRGGENEMREQRENLLLRGPEVSLSFFLSGHKVLLINFTLLSLSVTLLTSDLYMYLSLNLLVKPGMD